MRKIILPQGKGKTSELIRLSAQTGSYIVCHNQNEAARIQWESMKMELKIPCPLTYDEFLNKKYYGKGVKGFLIDNADMLLEYISQYTPIDAITITI